MGACGCMFALAEIGVIYAEDVVPGELFGIKTLHNSIGSRYDEDLTYVLDSISHNAEFFCRYNSLVVRKIWGHRSSRYRNISSYQWYLIRTGSPDTLGVPVISMGIPSPAWLYRRDVRDSATYTYGLGHPHSTTLSYPDHHSTLTATS